MAWRAWAGFVQISHCQDLAALRVMTPDGLPVYDQSEIMHGAFAASCHSGVTLAAAHAVSDAKYVADGRLGAELDGLSAGQFNV